MMSPPLSSALHSSDWPLGAAPKELFKATCSVVSSKLVNSRPAFQLECPFPGLHGTIH